MVLQTIRAFVADPTFGKGDAKLDLVAGLFNAFDIGLDVDLVALADGFCAQANIP
jgi:hypothetical protein